MLSDVVSTAIGGLIERNSARVVEHGTGNVVESRYDRFRARDQSYEKVLREQKRDEGELGSDRSKVAFVGQVKGRREIRIVPTYRPFSFEPSDSYFRFLVPDPWPLRAKLLSFRFIRSRS